MASAVFGVGELVGYEICEEGKQPAFGAGIVLVCADENNITVVGAMDGSLSTELKAQLRSQGAVFVAKFGEKPVEILLMKMKSSGLVQMDRKDAAALKPMVGSILKAFH